MREKNKLAYVKEYKEAKELTEVVKNDLEFLDRVDGQFDPFESAVGNIKSHRMGMGKSAASKRVKTSAWNDIH